MADQRKILELDIDVEAIIAKSSQLKTELDTLRATQAKLKESGDTNSETYVKLAAQISKTSSEFNVNQKQLANLATANGNYLTIQQKVGLALDKEVVSITEARNNNAELLKVRNELNLSKASEKALADEINAKLDANNAFIKENVSQYEKQKIGIGDYKTAITEAISETGLFSGQLSGLKNVYDTGLKVLSPFKNDIIATASGMRASAVATEGATAAQTGLTVATNVGTGAMRIFALAVAATGIGAIIIIIALLIGYLKGLDPVMDKIEQAFAGFGGVIEFLENKIGSFIEGITSVGDAMNKLGNFLAHPIDSMKSLGKEMANAAKEAANLKEREQDLEDQMNINSILNKKQESEISRLMIQAKDRSKSAAEQNKAFADAEKLNADIFERNKKAADEGLSIAIEEAKKKKKLTAEEIQSLQELDIARATSLLNQGKISIESYKKLQDSFGAKIDVENQYNEQLDKITTKSNNAIEKQQAAAEAAQKKSEEKKQKILDDAAALTKARLDLFLSEQGTKAKSLEEELRINETVLAKKLEIAKKEFEASKKTEADKIQLLVNENNAKNEYLQKQNELVVNNAQHELEVYIETNKSKIDSNRFLTEQLLVEEKARLDAIAQERSDYEALRLENGIINEQAYQDAIRGIQEETRIAKEEAQAERDQAAADKQIIDIENQLAQNQLDFDRDLALKLERLELQKQAELKAAEKSGADKNLILKKYSDAEVAIKNSVEQSKLALASQGLAQAKGLFKENTLAYKVLAIAEATINTYKAASLALSTYAYPVGGIFAGLAIAQGLLTVSNIVGVKLAKGAIDLDGPGSTTSDSIPAQLSRGESVINAEATANNKSLLQAINSNSGVDFAKQTFPSSVANIYNAQPSQTIDYDLMAGKIADANRSLPAPKVYTAITDINLGQKNLAEVTDGANF
jgi:hypothetical protein